jgi:hypothetical protein
MRQDFYITEVLTGTEKSFRRGKGAPKRPETWEDKLLANQKVVIIQI